MDPSPIPSESSCLFCLEPLKQQDRAINPIGCSCDLSMHATCLHAWFQQKHQLECPICHVVSVPNPSSLSAPPSRSEIFVVHIPSEEQDAHYQRMRRYNQCAGVCCLMIIVWWIGGIVLEFAF